MGSISLAWKDILRQKHRTILFITVQMAVTASALTIFGLDISISSQLESNLSTLNNTVLQIFSGYLTFLQVFAIVASISVAAVLSSLLSIARMNDLAVLSTLGGTFKTIQRVPLAEIFLLSFISGILGSFVGFFILHIYKTLFHFTQAISIDRYFVTCSIFIALQIIGTYFTSGLIVNLIIRKKFREIIDGQFDLVPINPKRILGLSTKNRPSFRLGYIFILRNRIISYVMAFGMLFLIFLCSFGILGGNIIIETTNSYSSLGYGGNQNIYVISTPEFAPILHDMYNPEVPVYFPEPFIYTDYVLPASFISEIPNDTEYVSRLLLVSTLKLIPSMVFDPDAIFTGVGVNEKYAYFWGQDINMKGFFQYYSVGENILLKHNYVLLGDGIPQKMFNKASFHSIMPLGNVSEYRRYGVSGIILDPFARGNCVHMSLREMIDLFEIPDHQFRTVLFVRNPSENVLDLIEEYNLNVFPLEPLKQKYFTQSNNFWFLTSLGFFPIILSAGFSLAAFSGLIANVILYDDLSILHALGSSKKTMKGLILWVNSFILLYSAPLAIYLAFAFAVTSVISDPAQLSITAWILIATEILILILILQGYLNRFFKNFYTLQE